MKKEIPIEAARHSLAHLLAATVRDLYPGAKNAIGPAIENGFYQDFELPEPISDADLPRIEKRMREILKTWKASSHRTVTTDEAKKEFAWNEYKSELIDDFAIQGKEITFYTLGDFLDLCKGGHSENPAEEIDPKAFKLDKVAGAYWRGDATKAQLTRIYGLAFSTKAELDEYLTMRAEAEKRDHKILGPKLDLFTFSDLVGPGLPLFTPKGTLVRNLLDTFVWELRKVRGYEQVDIPHITKKELYETSGHWDKYKDDLFKITTREEHFFAMKPMNCPHHAQLYARRPWSYREVPQRYASTTKVYRDEQSGELAGLTRVLAITQDDAHVFCRESQMKEEFMKVWDIVESFYGSFGFSLRARLSLHDPEHPEKYLGSPERWKTAEATIREMATERKADAFDGIGEAAFYGPKIDFMAKDAIGRMHQVATIQLDMNQPERFDLVCINEKGERERMVMIHAAIMGSIERFLAVIIEHFAGAFPVWLSPVQVSVLPVGEKFAAYGKKLHEDFIKAGIRSEWNDPTESLGKRIRTAEMMKVPYVLVVGEKEEQNGTVAVRSRAGDEGEMDVKKFLERLQDEIKSRTI